MTWFQYFLFSVVFYWSFLGLVNGIIAWDVGYFHEYSKKQKFIAQLCYGPFVWLCLGLWNLILRPLYLCILMPIFWISDIIWQKLE